MRQKITILFCFISTLGYAQDTNYLKVHFLYGSKPLKKYKATEQRWFGGKLGGHVGIQIDSNKIVSFLPFGKFHLFAKKNKRHSVYAAHAVPEFYTMFGGHPDSVKKAVFFIPITKQQKHIFDSLSTTYLRQTPYDYALVGMRCGAAAYHILAQLQILTPYGYRKTYLKIFYPKKLRKRLFKKAKHNRWIIEQSAGSKRRKWEQD